MIKNIYKKHIGNYLLFLFEVENYFIEFNKITKTIKCKKKGQKYILENSSKINIFDFVITTQNLSFKDKTLFFQIYYEALFHFFNRKNNFNIFIPLIDLLEESLEIPKESRWSIEKLKKEKKRTK